MCYVMRHPFVSSGFIISGCHFAVAGGLFYFSKFHKNLQFRKQDNTAQITVREDNEGNKYNQMLRREID